MPLIMGDQRCTEIIEIEGLGCFFRLVPPPDAPFEAFCYPVEPFDYEEAVAEEREHMSKRIGEIYSLRDSDGRFMLVEVVSASYSGLCTMVFADRFDERPLRVNRRALTRAPDEPCVWLDPADNCMIDGDDHDPWDWPEHVYVIQDE